MDKIELYGFAKINLTLDILGKRDDGFHEVEMVMQTIDLCDRIEIIKQETITVTSNKAEVPVDNNNLVFRAAEALKAYTGYQGGAHFHIEKQIPVAAGLAGGSSNAAAALKGLNKLWNLNLSFEEISKIGASLGSDIPFCLMGGTAVARGRGEILVSLNDIPPLDIVLVKPKLSVSTREVYSKFDSNQVLQKPNTMAMIEAIRSGDIIGITKNITNLLETVTFKMHPEVREIKESLISAGARAALMSGSGPTVFAVVDNPMSAEKVANKMRSEQVEVIVTKTIGKQYQI